MPALIFKSRNYFKIVLFLSVLTVSIFNCKASDNAAQPFSVDIQPYLRRIYQNIQTVSPQEEVEIAKASIYILKTLAACKKEVKVPDLLIKAAGKAHGQLSYISPYSLHVYELPLVPYLENGRLKHSDLTTPYYDFKFGPTLRQTERDAEKVLKKMANGQELALFYHLNLPVYFNRLLSEFNGEYLLLGGGERCECLEAATRHPLEFFYHIDIDNGHQPDTVIHAGYREHLCTLPTERFSFIWFEHCTVGELLVDHLVLNQYFRFAKPGAVFALQSNMLLLDRGAKAITEESFQNFIKRLESYKFSVLEYKESRVLRKNKLMPFKQLIFMKPYTIDNSKPMFASGPTEGIDLRDYRAPRILENYFALQRAHLLLGQLCLSLAIPFEQLYQHQNSTAE